jgi:integrase
MTKKSADSMTTRGIRMPDEQWLTGVRCIQMPPSVAELLKSKRQTAITEWVFPHFQHPEQPISPASAYRKLKVILKNAELPLIRFHDLRHTFATHATQGGVDPKTLAGILGHTNASFTLDTYTHVTSDMQKSASAVVGSMMQKIMIKE